MNIDDFDKEDEGWIWMPWEEIQSWENETDCLWNSMMDNIFMVSNPVVFSVPPRQPGTRSQAVPAQPPAA